MKHILLLFLIIPSLSCSNEETWSIHLQTISGWGNKEGVYFNSKGDIGTATGFLEKHIKKCTSISLSKDEISAISKLLKKIPEQIPNRSKIQMYDNCEDEFENYVVI